jgi:hypothetical protein
MVLMAKPERKLSLAPLSFDEAVTDILKIKPVPKASKKTQKAKKRRTDA